MKPILKFATFLLITVLFLVSCNKEEPPSEPKASEPKAKSVKGKVIEYGSDLPIAGATLSICTTALYNPNGYECAGNYLDFTTDVNGNIFFNTDSVYRFKDFIGILKDDYFELNEVASYCLFEDDTPGLVRSYNNADSFTVIKVPITYVTIHLKSVSSYDFPVVLTETGMLRSRMSALEECWYFGGHVFNLRPGIDTTFQYSAFGNADNLFQISKAWSNDPGGPIGEIMRTVRFIPKASVDTVEISF